MTLDQAEAGQTVTISVETENSEASTYEIIILPEDFPVLQAVSYSDAVSTDPIYVTLRPQGDTLPNYIAKLDNNAVPYFYRQVQGRAADFKIHPATNEASYLVRLDTENEFGRSNGIAVMLDENFNQVETVEVVGLSHTDDHDFAILPDNRLMLLSYHGSFHNLTDIGLSEQEFVEESVVQIIDRTTRDIFFEWRSLNGIPYTDQFYDPPRPEYAHINSATIDTDGNILASLRGTSNVVKIDVASGTVLWKLGGKSNQFQFENDPFTGPCGQHDVTRLANGNILVFDNGILCLPEDERGEFTRVVEYSIDEANLTAELVWSYSDESQYSRALGSAQRLDNGNTLIAWGLRQDVVPDTLDTVITEVDNNGEIVFELNSINPLPILIYRAFRFPDQ